MNRKVEIFSVCIHHSVAKISNSNRLNAFNSINSTNWCLIMFAMLTKRWKFPSGDFTEIKIYCYVCLPVSKCNWNWKKFTCNFALIIIFKCVPTHRIQYILYIENTIISFKTTFWVSTIDILRHIGIERGRTISWAQSSLNAICTSTYLSNVW